MSGTVSTRWFWSDWMSDPGLRACGYAARGLWKDLLCLAASNKREYGFVSLNGRKLSESDLARMTNGAEAEVILLLQELELNGVFSRDRRGIIYCRRMVRTEKNRTNGRLGGNPNLLKSKENQESVKPTPKALIPEPEPKPLESKESKTAASPKVAKRAKLRTAIPARAVLAEGENMEFAVSKGFSAAHAAAMFEEFRDYHIGKGNLMADWPAAWRTWVRNQIKFNKGSAGGSNGRPETNRNGDAKVGFSGLAARLRRNIEKKRADVQATFDDHAGNFISGDGCRDTAEGLELVASGERRG